MQTAKYIKTVEVNDPDTNGVVELAVYKHQNGGMFAIDSSFIDQVADNVLEDDRAIIVDPFFDVMELKSEAEFLILND